MQEEKTVSPLKWVPTAYFAMGLPLILLNLVAPLMFNDFGISDAQVAFWTSLLILPWSLKPFWSPLMEMYRTKKFFVVATQLLSGRLARAGGYGPAAARLLPLCGGHHVRRRLQRRDARHRARRRLHPRAFQDAAGPLHRLAGAFYNIAKVTAMGGLVYLAGVLEERVGVLYAWMTIMGICGAILFVLGLYHMRMLPSGGGATARAGAGLAETMRETGQVFLQFFRKRYIWIYIAFIVFYRFAEGLVIKIVPLFLKAPVAGTGHGARQERNRPLLRNLRRGGLHRGVDTGRLFHFVARAAQGALPALLHLQRALRGLCPAGVGAAVESRAGVRRHRLRILQLRIRLRGSHALHHAAGGPGKHQMAHYAFGSALANLGVMLPGMISGLISDAVGYRAFFLWALLATIPAFLITWFVPFTYPDGKSAEEPAEA